MYPHNDAVVVTLNIENYLVRRVLIDNDSSMDVLFYDTFSKMKIPFECLGWVDAPLVEFTDDAIPVERVVTLPMIADQTPCQSIAQVDFLVV